MKGYFTGVFLGGLPALVLVAVLVTLVTMKKSQEARVGWNLVPIVVLAVDVRPGDLVTLENLSQRSLPEQFVTDSNVRPDEVNVLLNRAISVPAQAGDPLVWGHFSRAAADQVVSKCLEAIHPQVQQAFEAATKRATSVLPFDETLSVAQPPSAAGPDGTLQAVAVKEDVRPGTGLRREQLEVLSVPANLMTDSLVPGSQLEKLVGKQLVGDVLKGDLLLWQLLDPGGPLACDQAANEAMKMSCSQAAQEAVRSYREGAK